MNTRWLGLFLVATLTAACGGEDSRSVEATDYEVVQEGAASGVTSTLQGPGQSIPPITGTNADTTTAFSIDPNAAVGSPATPPGTLAGTLPPVSAAPAYRPAPVPPASAPSRPAEPAAPAPEPRRQEPPPTETQPREPVPPTNTVPPPAPPPSREQPPPPREEPPPPPPAKEEPEEEEPPREAYPPPPAG